MSVSTFNFHDLAGVKIESDDDHAQRFFRDEYRLSESPLSDGLKLVHLNWSNGWNLWPSKPEYRFHRHKLFACWSYKIELGEERLKIEAFGNRTAVPMVHHMLVHPSLRYLCSLSDAIMLHGSAVVMNGKSLVFTGTGGTGKTTISSLLLHHGGVDWALHADDYTFLAPGPRTFSYMTRSHLYRDHLRWVPSTKRILSPGERLFLEFFGRLREISGDRVKWPLRLDSNRLWPHHAVASSAELAGIVLLGRTDASEPVLKEIGKTGDAIEKLIEMNFFEARHFIHLLRNSLGTQVVDAWLKDWKDCERSLLERVLQETHLFRLELPHVEAEIGEFGKKLVDVMLSIVASESPGEGRG